MSRKYETAFCLLVLDLATVPPGILGASIFSESTPTLGNRAVLTIAAGRGVDYAAGLVDLARVLRHPQFAWVGPLLDASWRQVLAGEPWRAQVEARLGKVPDRVLAREVGVSYETVRQYRVQLGIPRVLSPGLSVSRRRVLEVMPAGQIMTLAQVAQAAYGSDEDRARRSARPVLAWLILNGHAERVRTGEYRRAGVRTFSVG